MDELAPEALTKTHRDIGIGHVIKTDNPLSCASSVHAFVETIAHNLQETIPCIRNSVGAFAFVMPGCLPGSVDCKSKSQGVGGRIGEVEALNLPYVET